MQNTEAATGPDREGPHIATPSPSWSPDASMFLGPRLSVEGSNVAGGSHLIVNGILGAWLFVLESDDSGMGPEGGKAVCSLEENIFFP